MSEPQQKTIKRRAKKGTGEKLYFDHNTQAAIVSYQQASEKKIRDVLYVQEILPAFEKLAENLINIYKFSSLYDSYEDLKSDCVAFLFESIHKFDHTRGTAAFSYFNVIAKNFLIIKSKQKMIRTKKVVSLSDPDSMTQAENEAIDEHYTVQAQDMIAEKREFAKSITELLYKIRERLKNSNEIMCINSIIQIFENIDDVDLLNKSAVLLYIREMSGLNPKQLTTALYTIKKHYKDLKHDSRFELFG
jgi:hypothetical protein